MTRLSPAVLRENEDTINSVMLAIGGPGIPSELIQALPLANTEYTARRILQFYSLFCSLVDSDMVEPFIIKVLVEELSVFDKVLPYI